MIGKHCCVCDSNDSKYKCPHCSKLYCSVSCCKKHKEVCSTTDTNCTTESDTKKPQPHYEFPTEDTVSLDKLNQLRNCDEIKCSLQNPHVRKMILSILNSNNPTDAIAKAMTEPIFVELADACIKTVESADTETK